MKAKIKKRKHNNSFKAFGDWHKPEREFGGDS